MSSSSSSSSSSPSSSSSSSPSHYTSITTASHSSSSSTPPPPFHYPSNSEHPPPLPSINQSFELLARDAIERYVKDNQIIGLGSGSTIAVLVRELARLKNKNTLKFIVTSLQIKREAENSGLEIVDE